MEKSSGSEKVDRYTALNDPEIERKVNEIIEIIKNEIVRSIHPKSIILKGSFGRGEITVVENNNELKFLSDCEIIVIPNKRIKRGELSRLSSKFTRKTGLKVEITDLELELKFCIALHLWNRISSTIDNYESKHGSKVIYGENFLEKLPNFNAEEIPTWEGIRLMFNRMIESLQYFSMGYLNEYPSKDEERKLFFWVNKIILACQDALLILAKKYHYSYKVRNEIFQEIFPKHFETLEQQIPNFLSLTVKATEYKLHSSKIYSKDVVRLWFEVAEITDKVFRYIIEKDMGITFDSYTEFQEKYLKHPHIRKRYYRGLSPNPIYQNLRSAVKMWVFGHKIPTIKLMQKCMIPWAHVVYSTIPVVYFGVSKDGKVDDPPLTKAGESLPLLRKLSYLNLNFSPIWESTKRQVLDLWRTVCY
jgi:hypothetical protein